MDERRCSQKLLTKTKNMAYIPESKINKLNTPGGEFIIKSTNQGYVGDYIELSNGKFYVGSDPKQLNEELIIVQLINTVK